MKAVDKWFHQFVDDTRVALTGYVSRITGSQEDAKDVVQEAYLKVFCAARNDPALHRPAGLLYTTARNIAISRQRHLRVVQRQEGAVTIAEELRTSARSTEHKAGRREQMQMLLVAVNRLSPKCRSVMILRMLDGLSQQDIAERLGISISTVEKHLARGLRLCRADILAAGGATDESSQYTASEAAS